MAIVGIICEYNPFHKGHRKQFSMIRQQFGEATPIVCLMSGNYVQRGAPAIYDRAVRAEAAMLAGANLVLELPVTASLSSAEGFARAGVSILSSLCDTLCFGAETGDQSSLMAAADALLAPEFSEKLRQALSQGISFPAARQQALGEMGSLLEKPNDILAAEYCKALLFLNSPMQPFVISRQGSYHAETPDPENPSATALRRCITNGLPWLSYVPEEAAACFEQAEVHTLAAGERAILYRLRTMTNAEFQALPYGAEGLWRRLMHACREEDSLDAILTRVKTKRYTRTRLDRMVLCAFLGISREALEVSPPYARILAFDDVGRSLLKDNAFCKNLGWRDSSDYAELERRCNSLYGLFCQDAPPAADAEEKRRLLYLHR